MILKYWHKNYAEITLHSDFLTFSKLLFYNKSSDLSTCTCLSMILTCMQSYYDYYTAL